MRRSLVAASIALLASTAGAEITIIEAERDATLIEHAQGLLANGAGASIFVGRTGQPNGSIRRGLIRFDLSVLPKKAKIESVRLIVVATQASTRPGQIAAHRVLASWGEGPSVSMGGKGVPAAPGDATWRHRLFAPLAPRLPAAPASAASPQSARSLWHESGGDFAPEASSSVIAIGPGPRVWTGDSMVADVRDWVRHPKRNYGWLLLGDESASNTAIRLGSRQSMMMSAQPRLEILWSRGRK